jgi:hypothetical protein
MAFIGSHVRNDPEEINEIVRVSWQVSLAFEPHRRDGCPESGILPYQEIDYDIERRRISPPTSGRHSATAESHQTSQRYATEAPCRAGQAEVGKEGQLGRTAAQKRKAAKQAKPAASAREGSKSVRVLPLLRRPGGASRKELMKATGWLAHSVCGFLSGIVAKRMRLKLVFAKSEAGGRYTVPR